MPVKKAAPKGVDVDKFLEELVLGRHDDRLADITPAVGARVIDAKGKVYWRIEIDGLTMDRKDITLGEVSRVEQITGRSWASLHPSLSGNVFKAFLRAGFEARCEMTPAEAEAKADSFTQDQCEDAFDEYVVIPAPLGSALATTTS